MFDDLLEDSEFRFLFWLVFFTVILIIIHYALIYEWFRERVFFAVILLIVASVIKFSTILFDRWMMGDLEEW